MKLRRTKYPLIVQAIQSLTPEQFEKLGKKVLELLGCQDPIVTRRTGDQGIDFYGILKLSDFISIESPFLKFEEDLNVWLVGQAKHYPNRAINPAAVREIVGAIKLASHNAYSTTEDPYMDMDLRACESIFHLLWTTGTFSSGAMELCRSSGVIPKSGRQIAKYLADKGIGIIKVNDKEEFSEEAFVEWLET